MSVETARENCTDRSDGCLINEHASSMCHDCDGLGSVGALPCGRCAGSGIEPTSPDAAGLHQRDRADYGAIGNWRSRQWLLGGLLLRTLRHGQSH
jgi:hypothetical protein